MCGIFGLFGTQMSQEELEDMAKRMVEKLHHRGPDDHGFHVLELRADGDGKDTRLAGRGMVGHTRLSIVDVEGGHQPLYTPQEDCVLICNGEIYNHKELRQGLQQPYRFCTNSDSEVILALYKQEGMDFLAKLDGMFAFILVDFAKQRVVVARDPIGIKTLVTAKGENGELYFSSEVKALPKDIVEIKEFPNGNYWDSTTGEFKRYYEPSWWQDSELGDMAVPSAPADLEKVRMVFERAVKKRLMADVPVGVFLSGGLDSSLVAAVAKKYNTQEVLHSFSVGLENSPDLAAAREVAEFLGTRHHERIFTIEEGVQKVRDVIYYLETYDPGTIRSGVPMSMLTELTSKHVKVSLSGEGSDEVFAGYLYFYDSPSVEELHRETVRKVKGLHGAQVQFVDRLTMMHSLEGRVPFLDLDLLDAIFSMRPEDKLPVHGQTIEKHILRKAFEGYLPESVLWRQKEQFGDGVGFGWIDGLKAHCEATISDEQMAMAKVKFPHDPPSTKEQYFYRSIFEELFPYKGDASPATLITRWAPWSDPHKHSEPSGRVQGVHEQKVGV